MCSWTRYIGNVVCSSPARDGRMAHVYRMWWPLFTLYLFRFFTSAVGAEPCPSTAQSFVVAATEDARTLAMALNCSGGGTFDVLWEGTVVVDRTFVLTNGSVVSVSGVGPDAIVDGGGTTQLFTVTNATLYLTDIGLANGDASNGNSTLGFESGGAVLASGPASIVSCNGTTTFKNNTAYSGGAVSIEDGAVASWDGNASFDRNTAEGVGGAVSLFIGASVTCSGHNSFSRNSAHFGGAFYSIEGVFMFTGETTFTDNYANQSGAAIAAQLSEVAWMGVMSFENNTLLDGGLIGGAIDLYDSILSWQGKTCFSGGHSVKGGALNMFQSNVSWEGETVFRDNVADAIGGALSVALYSHVSWTGQTSFFNNTALGVDSFGDAFGGAVHVVDSSISWNGTTLFANNSASTGGAMYAGVGTRMAWGGNTTLMGNNAGANGGAVALGNDVSFNLEAITDLAMIENVAGIAGGAVYESGTSKGIIWNNATFISNSALNGGAVYSVGSGAGTVNAESFPNVYANCLFRHNTAAVSGGAIESAAGKDDFVDVVFKGNTAGKLGGGLRTAGTTNITSCDFVGNGADEAGPAVSNVGTIILVNSSFTNNNLLCAPGAFLNYTVEADATPEQSQETYYDSVCDGCDVCSGTCFVDGIGAQQCIPTLANTESAGVNALGVPITLETLTIDPGYWRSLPSSATILACWNEDACLGGVTDDASYCGDGYRGPYCAICADEYAATLAYTCSKCSSGEGIVFAALAMLVVLAVIFAVIAHLVSNNHDTNSTRFKRLTQALPLQGLKTVVVAWQILTQFDAVANVTYAGVYGQSLNGVASLVSFDLGLVLSAGCLAKTDFHQRLLISTLGPLLCLGALGVSFQVAARRNHGSREALRTIRRKHFSMALLVTFLVYSSVSSTVFRVFDCETLDDGRKYLRADYTLECTTAMHKALQVYAVLMIMLYPIGIPVLYAVILFKNRKILRNRRHRSMRQVADLEVTVELWKPYRPARYYYEVVECARRVTLTGVVVFIYPNTAAQVAVTLVLAFVFVVVSDALAPYASKQDAWMSRVAHIVVFMSMFQALMVKVDVSNESSDSQQVFGVVLLGANICMVAAVVSEAMMVVCYTFAGVKMVRWKTRRIRPGVPNASSDDVPNVVVPPTFA